MNPIQPTPINKKLPQWAIYLFEFLGVVACIMVATYAFLYWDSKNNKHDLVQTTVTPDPTANWKTYRNDEYGFEFKYLGVLTEENKKDEYVRIDNYKVGNDNSYSLKPGEYYIELHTNKSGDQGNIESCNAEALNSEKIIKSDARGYIIETEAAEHGGDPYTLCLLRGKQYIDMTVVEPFNSTEIHKQIFSTFKFISTSTNGISTECGYINNDYKPINKELGDKINLIPDVVSFNKEGYKLQSACFSYGKNLVVFDFLDGYWKNAPLVDSEELSRLGNQLVVGIVDDKLTKSKFYKINIPNYRYEGTGSMACNIDKYVDPYVLFVCVDAGDGGTDITWYAYDTIKLVNNKVKYIFRGRDDHSYDKSNLFISDLIKLFSKEDYLKFDQK